MTNFKTSLSPTASAPGAGQRLHDALPEDLPLPRPLALDQRPALFLDFDGTLVEIADHPDDVAVAPHLAATIAALSHRLDGRLAIVTGRSIAALEALLGPVEVAVAGSHGGEFRPTAGGAVQPLAEPLPQAVITALETFAAGNGGLLVEPKPYSAAVHYRRHPEARDALLARAESLAAAHGMAMKHGKQVIELTMPGSDKGSAVERFMGLPAFAGAHALFLGDDVTDEDAFRAVRRLGGEGVLVGPMRETAAARRLPGVDAVHEWLETALQGVTPA